MPAAPCSLSQPAQHVHAPRNGPLQQALVLQLEPQLGVQLRKQPLPQPEDRPGWDSQSYPKCMFITLHAYPTSSLILQCTSSNASVSSTSALGASVCTPSMSYGADVRKETQQTTGLDGVVADHVGYGPGAHIDSKLQQEQATEIETRDIRVANDA